MKIKSLTLLLATLFLTTAAYAKTRAGFMEFEFTNFAGPISVTVWYPTSNKVKESSAYDFFLSPEFRVPADATRDAPIKGGKFPLIVLNHSAGLGPQMRFVYFPNAERLAAEGYIVVHAGRNIGGGFNSRQILSELIDHMLEDHPLRDSVDASRIGAWALSGGGFGVFLLANGFEYFDIAPDPRVRGVIIDEGLGSDICQDPVIDCSVATIPIMLRDGSALPGVGDQRDVFDGFVNSFPRFLVTLRDVSHFGFVTGACALTEAARLLSLDYQRDVLGSFPPTDPRELSYFFASLSNGDEAGNLASLIWNIDTLGESGGLFGNGGDGCQPEYGGPVTLPPGEMRLEEREMIETLFALDHAFWQTVFGEGQTDNTKVEKAIEKLDTIWSFIKVDE